MKVKGRECLRGVKGRCVRGLKGGTVKESEVKVEYGKEKKMRKEVNGRMRRKGEDKDKEERRQ